MRTAILVRAHFTSRWMLNLYRSIQAGATDSDVILLYDATQHPFVETAGVRCFTHTNTDLQSLGLTFTSAWYDSQYAVMAFARRHPEYDRYWMIEYDVRFTGSWKTFFASAESRPEDLLGTYVRTYAERPDWFWWQTGPDVDKARRVSCFFPVVRFSRAAIAALETFHRQGVTGFCESVTPTIMKLADLPVGDLNLPGRVLYTKKTFFYAGKDTKTYALPWPGLSRNMLYHPVRPDLGWHYHISSRLRRVASLLTPRSLTEGSPRK